MFTGLVRAIGRLKRCSGGVQVQLESAGSLGEIALGDSIAVDGVCLTAAEILGGHGSATSGFRADVSEETLHRSALAERASAGARVNLEPALRPLDRLGGHLVSGHVDGIGRVLAIQRQSGSWRLELAWEDPSYGRYICPKASVAVDGISLTVAGCTPQGTSFWIAVIPHTWSATTLLDRQRGDRLNLEADLLAKYTERLLAARLDAQSAKVEAVPHNEALTAGWLAEHGWMG